MGKAGFCCAGNAQSCHSNPRLVSTRQVRRGHAFRTQDSRFCPAEFSTVVLQTALAQGQWLARPPRCALAGYLHQPFSSRYRTSCRGGFRNRGIRSERACQAGVLRSPALRLRHARPRKGVPPERNCHPATAYPVGTSGCGAGAKLRVRVPRRDAESPAEQRTSAEIIKTDISFERVSEQIRSEVFSPAFATAAQSIVARPLPSKSAHGRSE